MKYKLIKEINPKYSALEQVLTNRGVPLSDISHYLNTADSDIESFNGLGPKNLKEAATALIQTIKNNEPVITIIDSDCDGFTSSALLINYLYDLFPTWVLNKLTWFMHGGKQHGLSDCFEQILKSENKLVLIPDAGSNDHNYHKQLAEAGIKIVILDHHELESPPSEYAVTINNQSCDYKNKHLSGVGVTWQFCKYLDSLLGKDNADNYLDLVALGLTGDMMSLLSVETKHLIQKGFKQDNIKNPFIYSMWQKNRFKLGEEITSWGAAFYIVPFVNALTRSGIQEEKELIFKSMLKFKAFEKVLSTKRGHKLGEMETIAEQAMRTCTNVKNRQTRAQDAGMEMLENLIEKRNLLENKALIFLLEPGQIDRNIAGLVANKLMAKYQRPVCVLTKVTEDIVEFKNNEYITTYIKVSYQGSARGCDKVGIAEFKDICAGTGLVDYVAGHQAAFGIGIPAQNMDKFISALNSALADMPDEAIYYVDYIFNQDNVNPQHILDIAGMNNLWGKDIDESLIALENIKITKDMVRLMSPDKTPTLRITLPNVSLIKFGSSQEEYEKFISEGFVKADFVGKCNSNEWMGNVTPQILIEDYDITEMVKYLF